MAAQVDRLLARQYFAEVAVLCERDAGRLWGVSLCGPLAFADAASGTIATSETAPAEERPGVLGFANTAVEWGGQRWATLVWQFIPAEDASRRGRLLLHELFHRVQPGLGLITPNGRNDHLDTPEGRYWLRLEWRALAEALRHAGSGRANAIRDALAFRNTRHEAFAGAAENERREEIREGLAQYTGTVVAMETRAAAMLSAVSQLEEAESQPTFVRTFAYPSGAAYGILLDDAQPGWTREVRDSTNLARLLAHASGLEPSTDPVAAADRYGGRELRVAEDERERERVARLAELRRRYIDGPVLTLAGASGAVYITTGATPLPGEGTVFMSYRLTAEWGSVVAENGILVSADGRKLTLSRPTSVDGSRLAGDGWVVVLAPGWTAVAGPRPADLQLVRTPGADLGTATARPLRRR